MKTFWAAMAIIGSIFGYSFKQIADVNTAAIANNDKIQRNEIQTATLITKVDIGATKLENIEKQVKELNDNVIKLLTLFNIKTK